MHNLNDLRNTTWKTALLDSQFPTSNKLNTYKIFNDYTGTNPQQHKKKNDLSALGGRTSRILNQRHKN